MDRPTGVHSAMDKYLRMTVRRTVGRSVAVSETAPGVLKLSSKVRTLIKQELEDLESMFSTSNFNSQISCKAV